MLARLPDSHIRVDFVGGRAILLGPFPVVVHPATIAATYSIYAVNSLLLGESTRGGVILDGLHTLLSRGGSKGPTGTAASLVPGDNQSGCSVRVFTSRPVDTNKVFYLICSLSKFILVGGNDGLVTFSD